MHFCRKGMRLASVRRNQQKKRGFANEQKTDAHADCCRLYSSPCAYRRSIPQE